MDVLSLEADDFPLSRFTELPVFCETGKGGEG
jgi:hypothetical protein